MYKGKVRNCVTNEQIRNAVQESGGNFAAAARVLSEAIGRHIDRALVNYWHRQLEAESKPAYERELRTEAAAGAAAPERPSIIDPSREELYDTRRILVVPDIHAPYQHPHALDFLYEVQKKYSPTCVVCTGDEVDNHGLSFHDSDPNLDSAGPELAESRLVMRDLAFLFPDMLLCHSNHGSLHFRRAKKYAIPVEYLKDYIEVLFPNPDERPNWRWQGEHKLTLPNGQKVLFRHGEGVGNSVVDNAGHEGTNLVVGHWHSKFSITYAASSERLYWGVYGGCLIDAKALAFEYGRHIAKRPILGCTVIVDSIPTLIPMTLNSRGEWTGKL